MMAGGMNQMPQQGYPGRYSGGGWSNQGGYPMADPYQQQPAGYYNQAGYGGGAGYNQGFKKPGYGGGPGGMGYSGASGPRRG